MVSTVTPAFWASSSIRQRASVTPNLRKSVVGLTATTLRAYTYSVLPPGVSTRVERSSSEEVRHAVRQWIERNDASRQRDNSYRSQVAGAFVAGHPAQLGAHPRRPARRRRRRARGPGRLTVPRGLAVSGLDRPPRLAG